MRKIFSMELTAILIRIAMVLCFISLFLMPWAARIYRQVSIASDDVTVPLLVTFYVCAVIGFAILFLLDALVRDIRKGEVFTEKNVKRLRTLSYCCFAITIITLLFARLRILMFIVTFGAAFIGLILRVIKNCFEQAMQLKEENDLTV